MPGLITHYICGQAVAYTATPAAREILNRYQSIYNIGTQGPDVFFYYLPGLINKRLRGVGVQMHQQSTGLFILSMADCLKNMPHTTERNILFAYTSGYLTHYALDAGAHPYVYAHTSKEYMRSRSHSIRNSVDHRKFETAIDVLMLKLMSGKKPADYKLWQLLHADTRQTQAASEAISASIQKAYARDVTPRDVYKAFTYMIQLTRILQSRKGRRKRLMEIIEDLTIGDHLCSSLIHTQDISDGTDYLNMGKSLWCAPWDKQSSSNASFVDLYRDAVADARDMVSMLYDYMIGSATKQQLLERIGSRSLSTGAECV